MPIGSDITVDKDNIVESFAKNYIIAGGDCTYLQRLLGHSTLTMTNHYLNLYSTDLQKNYDLFNPLDNLTKQSEKQ